MGLRIKALAVFEGEKAPDTAEELVTQAAEYFSGQGGDYQRAAALVDLSMYQEAQGKLQQANATRAQVLELASEIGAPLPLAVAYGNRARGAHQTGDFEAALRFSQDALEVLTAISQPTQRGHCITQAGRCI